MGKFDGILLMSDLDGTLCDGGRVSTENSQAIAYFQSEGGLFSVGSGRKPDWLLEWVDYFVPNTYSAMLNGAVICDPRGENPIFVQPCDADVLEVSQMLLARCPHAKSLTYCGCFEPNLEVKVGEEIDYARLPKEIFKCLMQIPDQYSDEYAEAVRCALPANYISMRSWIRGIEYQKKGTGKGDAIHRLKSRLGDAARIAVAVGNYENDIDMIKAADIGYAVGDSIPSVLAVADRVTVPCREHSIAAIIEELEKHRTLL